MKINVRPFFILVLFFILNVAYSGIFASQVSGLSAQGPHWVPEDPEKKEDVNFYVYVMDTDPDGENNFFLELDGRMFELHIKDTDGRENNYSLLHTTFRVNEGGTYPYNVTLDENGTSIILYSGVIIVSDIDESKNDDTVFGLPRWWCVITVVIGTIFLLFLTWSYFKGRAIQKERMADRDDLITCSNCGSTVGKKDINCNKCGSTLEDIEYVCGKCGKPVKDRSESCPHCGSRLKTANKSIYEKRDNDLLKLKRDVDKEKRTCPHCEAVIYDSDKKCPACSEII